MNLSILSHLIDETKKWVEETHFDQKMIDMGEMEIKVSLGSEKKESRGASLKDFFNEEHFTGVEVLTLIKSEQEEETTLINKLTHAIDTRIAKAKVVPASFLEENNLWEELQSSASSLRHILIAESELYSLPNLLKHYQKQPKRTVLNASLFLLADLKCYNQDISLKKSLWATLLSEL